MNNSVDMIVDYCLNSGSKNPVHIMQELMRTPLVNMHGPEHHILVGAALLTAYKNAGGDVDQPAALDEMKNRGSRYPGGACGYWGCCGAAVSTGMFYSIVMGNTPLSGKSWGEANLITAKALQAIGEIGGPRCCKRNSITAVISAVEFVKCHLGVEMELPAELCCEFSTRNEQCIAIRCPYNV